MKIGFYIPPTLDEDTYNEQVENIYNLAYAVQKYYPLAFDVYVLNNYLQFPWLDKEVKELHKYIDLHQLSAIVVPETCVDIVLRKPYSDIPKKIMYVQTNPNRNFYDKFSIMGFDDVITSCVELSRKVSPRDSVVLLNDIISSKWMASFYDSNLTKDEKSILFVDRSDDKDKELLNSILFTKAKLFNEDNLVIKRVIDPTPEELQKYLLESKAVVIQEDNTHISKLFTQALLCKCIPIINSTSLNEGRLFHKINCLDVGYNRDVVSYLYYIKWAISDYFFRDLGETFDFNKTPLFNDYFIATKFVKELF